MPASPGQKVDTGTGRSGSGSLDARCATSRRRQAASAELDDEVDGVRVFEGDAERDLGESPMTMV
jgi:hypothetical protein